MIRRLATLSVLVLLLAPPIFATGQRGDILVLNGKQYWIFTNPLRPFLDENPDKLPKSNVISTSLWRGYVATWEIKENQLFLIDVGILKGSSDDLQSVMEQMFAGSKEVLAKWFSGYIIVPDGKLVNYVHMGYASTYEKYIMLRIENGVLKRDATADTATFAKFRDAQFAAYKKTDTYRGAFAKLVTEERGKSDGWNKKRIEEFLREIDSEFYLSTIFDEPK